MAPDREPRGEPGEARSPGQALFRTHRVARQRERSDQRDVPGRVAHVGAQGQLRQRAGGGPPDQRQCRGRYPTEERPRQPVQRIAGHRGQRDRHDPQRPHPAPERQERRDQVGLGRRAVLVPGHDEAEPSAQHLVRLQAGDALVGVQRDQRRVHQPDPDQHPDRHRRKAREQQRTGRHPGVGPTRGR